MFDLNLGNVQSNKISINDEEFRLLSELINEVCGLYYTPSKKYMLENKLSTRLKTLNLNTFKDYYLYLKYDINKKKEFDILIDLLTINETFFYRETGQMELLVNRLIPEMIKSQTKFNKTIKIWSAASSSGEEAYTLAMILKESNVIPSDWKVEIIATDISLEILEKAKKAIYSSFSFRAIKENIKNKYFEKEGLMNYKLKDEIKNMVKFDRFNLLDFNSYNKFNGIDFIFCRNVLIYFEDEVKKKIVESFYKILDKNGTLFLGHSETLFKFSVAFELKQYREGIGYIKL